MLPRPHRANSQPEAARASRSSAKAGTAISTTPNDVLSSRMTASTSRIPRPRSGPAQPAARGDPRHARDAALQANHTVPAKARTPVPRIASDGDDRATSPTTNSGPAMKINSCTVDSSA